MSNVELIKADLFATIEALESEEKLQELKRHADQLKSAGIRKASSDEERRIEAGMEEYRQGKAMSWAKFLAAAAGDDKALDAEFGQ